LANQYQLLVDQRQADIDRLNKSLEQKNLIVERVEKTNHDEVNLSLSLFKTLAYIIDIFRVVLHTNL
jgi:hypothetical protein